MKKLILLVLPFAAFFSCNTEIPREQFLNQITSDCIKKQANQFLGESATSEQKEEFCDCFAATMAGDEDETITMKAMLSKLKNAEAFSTELEACKVNALNGVQFEEPDVTIVEGDEIQEDIETKEESEVENH